MKANLNKNRSSIIRKENSRSDLLFEEKEKELRHRRNSHVILFHFSFHATVFSLSCLGHRAIFSVYRRVRISWLWFQYLSILYMFRWMEWCIHLWFVMQSIKDWMMNIILFHPTPVFSLSLCRIQLRINNWNIDYLQEIDRDIGSQVVKIDDWLERKKTHSSRNNKRQDTGISLLGSNSS